jgi:hypothetical protein
VGIQTLVIPKRHARVKACAFNQLFHRPSGEKCIWSKMNRPFHGSIETSAVMTTRGFLQRLASTSYAL